MKSVYTVSLDDIHFHARIGVFDQERVVGNEFVVNLEVSFPAPGNVDDNSLPFMISYADLYEVVKVEMERGAQLLETIASRIASEVLGRWEIVTDGKISIAKLRPPIPGMVGSAKVSLSFQR